MLKVKRGQEESLESLLRRFKKMCNQEGVFRELKRRTFYEKPTDKNRRKQKEKKKNIRKYLSRSGFLSS